MRSYVSGTELVFATSFKDPQTGGPALPSVVTLELMDPSGTISELSVSTDAPGVYKSIYTPIMPGLWRERWAGTGAVNAATETTFEIRPSPFLGSPT